MSSSRSERWKKTTRMTGRESRRSRNEPSSTSQNTLRRKWPLYARSSLMTFERCSKREQETKRTRIINTEISTRIWISPNRTS